ncbi:MAG: hypothetical protein K8L97_17165 [Anaerolineae bacterium]|nr:hypothetical protein [Anaerolineae bacterium]
MSSPENITQIAPAFTLDWVLAPKPVEASEDNPNHLHESLFPALEQHPVPEAEVVYPTGFGTLTFSELYAATRRIVGFALRDQLSMVNPEDIDDCMQSGYLKVWEQLQKQPDLFAGKPKKYVVQAIVMRSKAQRYAHVRHYRKIVYNADTQAHQNTDDLTIAQVDTWIDLAQAIQRVAAYTADLDSPIYLLALYSLITDVKTQAVAQTMQHGLSTLTAAKRRIRVTLANVLPHYGTTTDSVVPLALPKIQPFHLAQLHRQLITPQILEDVPLRPNTVKSANNWFDLLVPSLHHLDAETSPNVAPEVRYETRWRETVTLEELLADTAVRKVAFAKMRSLGYIGEDAQDCFQLGTINLWKALQIQPGMLADKGAAWVGVWIAHAGSRRSLWKHRARSVPLHDPELTRYTRPERWASWATRVDKRIDFTLLMNALAQRYDGDPLKLFALYSLTTSVKMKDVQSVAHADKNQLIQARNAVKNDLRELLTDDENCVSDTHWLEQLQRGEHLACVTQVAEQVMDNQRLLLALYIITTSATRKDVTTLFGIPLTRFRQDIIQVKHLLAAAFQKVKSDTAQAR